MNAYEEILGVMRKKKKKDNTEPIRVGIMDGPDSCSIGDLKLSGNDLLTAEHLKTGYHFAVDGDAPSKKNAATFAGPLKAGDKVAVYRLSDELYIILERLV